VRTLVAGGRSWKRDPDGMWMSGNQIIERDRGVTGKFYRFHWNQKTQTQGCCGRTTRSGTLRSVAGASWSIRNH
jgi:hypothetical protein